jgi:hypothetical protein
MWDVNQTAKESTSNKIADEGLFFQFFLPERSSTTFIFRSDTKNSLAANHTLGNPQTLNH